MKDESRSAGVRGSAAQTAGAHVLLGAVRDELPFLLEWIAYHKVIGFDRIALCSNDCTDGTDRLLDALAAAGEIAHFPQSVPEGARPQAMAARRFRSERVLAEGDWAIWLDADEFLLVRTGAGRVADLVRAMGEARGIAINWRLFGDGGNAWFPGRFVGADFVHAAPYTAAANRSVKMFYRVGDGVEGPAEIGVHRPLMAAEHDLDAGDFLGGNGQPLSATARRNARWLAGRDALTTHASEPAEQGWALAQINHYCVRTPEHYARKQARGRGWGVKGDGADPRHDAEFQAEMNRNEKLDREILVHERAVDAELARLRAIPEVLAAEEAGLLSIALDRLPARKRRQALSGPAERFEITFPEAVKAFVTEVYGGAETILEYGSGGSTFVALDRGATVTTVESDPLWSASIARSLAHHFPAGGWRVHWADVGPTKMWGVPVDRSAARLWPLYALGVWDKPWFTHPDVVLIDGRFRPACLIATLMRAERPVTVLWDDYANRPEYHWVEDILRPVGTVDRMARFEVTPGRIPPAQVSRAIMSFCDIA